MMLDYSLHNNKKCKVSTPLTKNLSNSLKEFQCVCTHLFSSRLGGGPTEKSLRSKNW